MSFQQSPMAAAGAREGSMISLLARSPSDQEHPLRSILQSLERAGVQYCLLGRHDDAPPDGRSDVDLVVPAELLPDRLGEILHTVAARHGGSIVQLVDHDSAWSFVLAGRASGSARYFVRLDAWPAPDVRGLRFHRGVELLANRRRHRGVYLPAPALEFGCSLTRRLAKGDLTETHTEALAALYASDPAGCEREIVRFWRGPAAQAIVAGVRSGAWDDVRRRAGELGAALRRAAVLHGLVGTARRVVARHVVRGRHFLRPRNGLHVVLLGPDGVGKSTLMEALRRELAGAFSGVSLQTVPPSLKQLRDGTYRVRAMDHSQGSSTRPHALPDHSLGLSLLKLAYWLLYYLVVYQFTVRPALARGRLVLHHRYLVDALVDPRRYRYAGPGWLLRLMWRVTPKPDLIIILDAPPEVIRARKRELPLEEIGRQRAAYRALADTLPNGRILDAARPIDRTVAEATEIALRSMAERTARRLRLGTAP
jgi:thymidylate kinase